VLFALVCAAVAIAYGIGLTVWLLRQPDGDERMREIARAVQEGAAAYLRRQYATIAAVAIVPFLLLGFYHKLGWGTAVGFLVATLRRRSPTFGGWRYGHVYDAYVKGPFRRRGVGTKLVEEAFRWFRRHGVRRVQLQVRARNVAGLRFWKDLKFDDLAKTLERRV